MSLRLGRLRRPDRARRRRAHLGPAMALAAVAGLVSIASAQPAGGGGASVPSMADANQAYFAGEFTIAIARYETLADRGVLHEELFYNLGNAYFRASAGAADQLGRAIYNYERALRLDPDFEDARYNLEVARAAVSSKVTNRLEGAEGEPFWVRQATRFSLGTLSVALAVASFLFFGGLLGIRYQPAGVFRSGTMLATSAVGIGTLAVAVLLAGQVYLKNRVDMGVVLPDEAELREAPDAAATERGSVHAGLRVRLMAREPGWIRIRLSNGHEGWLKSESVGEL